MFLVFFYQLFNNHNLSFQWKLGLMFRFTTFEDFSVYIYIYIYILPFILLSFVFKLLKKNYIWFLIQRWNSTSKHNPNNIPSLSWFRGIFVCFIKILDSYSSGVLIVYLDSIVRYICLYVGVWVCVNNAKDHLPFKTNVDLLRTKSAGHITSTYYSHSICLIRSSCLPLH